MFRPTKKSAISLVTIFVVVFSVWVATGLGYSDSESIPAFSDVGANAIADAPDKKTEDPAAQNFINVKHMVRGYCHAASQAKDTKALGGFGPSENQASRVRSGCKGRGLYVLAQPGIVTQLGPHQGMRVVLVNQSDRMLGFGACDSRISMIQEAQDETGTWRPIEYLPLSWCGNSYHQVFLASGHFWQFAAPRYQGEIATKLRFSLILADKSTIHSNVFEGSVNPEQFSVKQGHTPTNLMDPYVD